jgi:hypothetical protein
MLTPKRGNSTGALNEGPQVNISIFKNNPINSTSFYPRNEYEENEAVSIINFNIKNKTTNIFFIL